MSSDIFFENVGLILAWHNAVSIPLLKYKKRVNLSATVAVYRDNITQLGDKNLSQLLVDRHELF